MIEYGTILRYFAMSIARYREPRGKHVHGWMAVNESLQSPIMAFVISKAYRPLYILIRIFQCWKCSIRTVCRYSIYLLLTTDKKTQSLFIYSWLFIEVENFLPNRFSSTSKFLAVQRNIGVYYLYFYIERKCFRTRTCIILICQTFSASETHHIADDMSVQCNFCSTRESYYPDANLMWFSGGFLCGN